ncbi:NTP transferase domain-containing protein [Polaribacter gangjinensis]|uniref:Probable molybdenum cofactor guanylyltransferase n=1 Tax=Polaribacter gangjinensis TaxID=574710 RepID=A0A2S7WCI4_9FLAO|nr:NTP transferase domain-containing protein [Polaribacter gangjinensis]PQJ75345.1 molybdenum cofactor guanylyltransferase [Polaribacter gangjinensis]
MNKHQKHTHLSRRNNDIFAPNEIAILGAKCDVISDLVHQISAKLSHFKLAYFDASHAKDVTPNTLSEFTFHHEGNVQIATFQKVNSYQQRLVFSQFDLLFINGNHFEGVKQILILDEEKEASVLKRMSQLTNIQGIIKLKKETAIFPFLIEKFPEINNIPCFSIDEIDKISILIKQIIQQKIGNVKGLILIGGKSTRMGTNKSLLNFHGKPQKEFAKELLEKQSLETYFSVANLSENPTEISDTFLNLGPFGGICSAFQKDANSAWFVLATDLPFVNEDLIKLLLQKRNPSKVATAIKGKNMEFVEPLITIYEPKAYPILLQYLAQGYSCPRKMLINNDVEIVEVEDDLIRNINTPEEFEAVLKQLKNN